jgi:hypothetical protein
MKGLIVILFVLLALLSSGLAQQSPSQPLGRVSYIEPDAKPEILFQGSPYRLPSGFIEVVHDRNLARCKARDFTRCSKFEWSVPFTLESEARNVERALSEAWNRFDARMYWRVNTAINGGVAHWSNCTLQWWLYDGLLKVWDRNAWGWMDAKDFCDDLRPEWDLFVATSCSSLDAFTRWDKLAEVYAREVAHAYLYYYPQYWGDVLKAMAKHMPLALWWDGPYPVPPGSSSGLVFQPVVGPPNPQQYVELAQKAQQKDLRGAAYMLARYPFLDLLANSVTSQIVTRLPTEGEKDGFAGLEWLEPLKTTLTTRETIFSRANQWASWGWFGLPGPEPQGSSGAATPYEYAGVGAVPIFGVQSQFAFEFSPRVPIFWRVCFTETFPPIPVPVPLPMPMLMATTRINTHWQTVPEGYPIKEIKGFPYQP